MPMGSTFTAIYLQSLHLAIAAVSADLVAHPAQYKSGVPLQWRRHPTDPWSNGTQQVAFVYGSTVFVESSGPDVVQVLYNGAALNLTSQSILILQDGHVIWNSSHVLPAVVQRVNKPMWSNATNWQVWSEGPYSALSGTLREQCDIAHPVRHWSVFPDLPRRAIQRKLLLSDAQLAIHCALGLRSAARGGQVWEA
jgi:hypothetical protein